MAGDQQEGGIEWTREQERDRGKRERERDVMIVAVHCFYKNNVFRCFTIIITM